MNMNRKNYQRELEKIIDNNILNNKKPTLLLHGCCAPCSSYVLEYLTKYFKITVLFYNPNIYPKEEYYYRAEELKRLIVDMRLSERVDLIVDYYAPEEFFNIAKGLKDCPEGGERCFECYRLRLRRAAQIASGRGLDYFGTTLTISPLKNTDKLNEIGEELAIQYGIKYLPSDFKKKNGYKRSVELSGEYNLYRQDFCGCIYSKNAKVATTKELCYIEIEN